MEITRQQLTNMIDHSLLRPNATREQLAKLCHEAMEYRFKAVCVNPIHVAEAAQLLKGSKVLVCSVVGFPFGTHSHKTKAFETKEVIRLGAQEIDMVIRVGALKEGRDREVMEDIQSVVHAATGNPVKVILETCYINAEEIIRGCKLSVEAGASFVKTSTGFAEAGAKVEDVRLMRKTVGKDFGVKAAGGIRTLEDALKMIEAGATRLGTSASVAIIQQFDKNEKGGK
ncbi:MAG: deoxyribose-phosphate aldolase [Deltaproteobacteria bacterium]|nr:deoxyribose-phosphate aldolase [Deltaproteobacteria bacterium]